MWPQIKGQSPGTDMSDVTIKESNRSHLSKSGSSYELNTNINGIKRGTKWQSSWLKLSRSATNESQAADMLFVGITLTWAWWMKCLMISVETFRDVRLLREDETRLYVAEKISSVLSRQTHSLLYRYIKKFLVYHRTVK